MRYKILSGVGVGLLATAVLATPAQAISATSSDVYVVHGIPGLTVDVYVDDVLTLEDFTPGTVNQSVSLVAHYDAAGVPTLGAFVNDISTIPAGQGRLTVRHTAGAGAVAIVANGAIDISEEPYDGDPDHSGDSIVRGELARA